MMAEQRTFSGDEARLLLRRARTGTLASLNRDGGGPYASLVNVATDAGGAPLLLLSALAWHTKNLEADPRASIMVAELPARGDALTGPRITVMGRLEKIKAAGLRRRYLARHPAAAMYAGFGDFAFWRMAPERVHAVAGFGRIETLEAGEAFPPTDEIARVEESAIAHMNEDHGQAVRFYATKLLGARDGEWRVAAIDGDGADLVLGEESLRLKFERRVESADELRSTCAALAKRARN